MGAAISGRYQGAGTGGAQQGVLELRIDVDVRYSADSPVLNRISGDFFQQAADAAGTSNYLESWIVDLPVVTWAEERVTLTGAVRYWHRVSNPATQVRITVPRTGGVVGPATVEFGTGGTVSATYVCDYRSDGFREVLLELDYAASVDVEPHVPSYDTHSHPNRPADLSRRTLTIETSYREAGAAVTINPDRTVIDDSASGFTRWSPAELHDAMETAFSRFTSAWPSWNLWGLQAGTFDSPSVGGVMFDASAGFGGAGRSPDRQGFAVFRKHSWFADLVAAPQNQAQAQAMRQFLYTWVHEAGHAFNFLHSWDKSRPSALSWMNYDWKYDQLHGADKFWANFRFRFDDPELVHLRHGDRASVIMGGDPWASGGHLESPSWRTAEAGPEQPLELLLRAQPFFAYMEPVEIEFRLRNRLAEPQTVDARLDPKYGATTVFVLRPDGSTVQFDSVMCLYGDPEPVELAPADGVPGPDRYSELVPLTFGRRGFVFDQPGQYQVRAVYASATQQAVSNTLVVRIGQPATPELDRFATGFFSREVGLALSFGGSMSAYLAQGMDILNEAADRFAAEPLGAKLAATVARSVGRDFFARELTPDVDRMVRRHRADPAAALAITEPGLEQLRADAAPSANLPYNNLVALRADLHIRNGDPELARQELVTLAVDLGERGVNTNVLEDIQAKADAVD